MRSIGNGLCQFVYLVVHLCTRVGGNYVIHHLFDVHNCLVTLKVKFYRRILTVVLQYFFDGEACGNIVVLINATIFHKTV